MIYYCNFLLISVLLFLIFGVKDCIEHQYKSHKTTYADSFYLKIISPPELESIYMLSPGKIGPKYNSTFTNGSMTVSQPEHACAPLSHNVAGKIAFIIRGGCSFVSKAVHAQEAGAVAMVVYDYSHLNKKLISMVPDDSSRQVRIPTAFLSGTDGNHIASSLSRLNIDSVQVMFPLNNTGMPMETASTLVTWTLW